MQPQPTDEQIIESVLNQSVKSGIFQNMESVAILWRAWNTIKYKLEQSDDERNNTNSN